MLADKLDNVQCHMSATNDAIIWTTRIVTNIWLPWQRISPTKLLLCYVNPDFSMNICSGRLPTLR